MAALVWFRIAECWWGVARVHRAGLILPVMALLMAPRTGLITATFIQEKHWIMDSSHPKKAHYLSESVLAEVRVPQF